MVVAAVAAAVAVAVAAAAAAAAAMVVQQVSSVRRITTVQVRVTSAHRRRSKTPTCPRERRSRPSNAPSIAPSQPQAHSCCRALQAHLQHTTAPSLAVVVLAAAAAAAAEEEEEVLAPGPVVYRCRRCLWQPQWQRQRQSSC